MNKILMVATLLVLGFSGASLVAPTAGAVTVCSPTQEYTAYAGVYCKVDLSSSITVGAYACTDPSASGGGVACGGYTCIGTCPFIP